MVSTSPPCHIVIPPLICLTRRAMRFFGADGKYIASMPYRHSIIDMFHLMFITIFWSRAFWSRMQTQDTSKTPRAVVSISSQSYIIIPPLIPNLRYDSLEQMVSTSSQNHIIIPPLICLTLRTMRFFGAGRKYIISTRYRLPSIDI